MGSQEAPLVGLKPAEDHASAGGREAVERCKSVRAHKVYDKTVFIFSFVAMLLGAFIIIIGGSSNGRLYGASLIIGGVILMQFAWWKFNEVPYGYVAKQNGKP